MHEIISLVSTCDCKSTYWTRKNKKKNPDKIERQKYCPGCRKRVLFREKK
ncbi:MAG TPA: 50S ribosomal protein L33 [Candidatus Omnitrophota bacterium]|nr:50S ribosomal protein L33 [Candidatus Omnitrophota bacterium]HPS36202.1 50S ribosomal protein L33 [Candidatus Omnitrophota bacterium]